MRQFEIRNFCETDAFLELYLREKTYEFVNHDKRPLAIIFPGGGYHWLADREAEPIALQFVRAGFQACVLRYSVRKDEKNGPALGDTPLHEAACAIAYARAHADDWGIDPEKITVIGFSAGGHLAASIATLWNAPERTGVPAQECRPSAAVLCYAVMTAFGPTHPGSVRNLLGSDGPTERDALYSPDCNVTQDTVPCFIWHTKEDNTVPVEGALKMANALQNAGVPYALHIYTHGHHGLSLATAEVGEEPTAVSSWFGIMLDWLEYMKI